MGAYIAPLKGGDEMSLKLLELTGALLNTMTALITMLTAWITLSTLKLEKAKKRKASNKARL